MNVIAAALSASLVAFPLAALAETVSVQTAAGAVDAPLKPATVVAFDLSAIDTLSALGVAVAGVPKVAAPAYLAPAMAQAEIVGTLFEPDFEALAVMAPDLIVAGGRSQKQVAPLSAIAPTLDMTILSGDIVAEAKARATAYGAIFGAEDRAAGLIASLEASIDATAAATKGHGNVLILLANGGKISAYGAGSRFGWMHSALALPEAVPDLDAETHGEAVSFEFIAETNPDWIFVVDRGAAIGQAGEAASATLDTPLVAGTRAGQRGQILYLDSAPLYLAGGGITSLLGTLAEIKAAFTDATDS